MLIPRVLRGANTRTALPLLPEVLAHYENMTFPTGTMHEPARQTIDHGRVATLERREKFAQLEAVLVLQPGAWNGEYRLENRELLSPRRIYRKTQTGKHVPALVADKLFELMRDWRDAGYPEPNPANARRGMPEGTIYKATLKPDWAWDIYLVKRG